MSLKSVEINKKEKTITIVLDLEEVPYSSISGKAMIVASSRGDAQADVKIDDKVVRVSASAYFRV